MTTLFKIVYGFDVIIAIVILYFFFTGIADGTVSQFNALLWLVISAVLAFVLFGSLWFNSHNYIVFSFATLLIIAIPALLFLLYFLIAIFGCGSWT